MITFRQTIRGDAPILSEILYATSCPSDAPLDGLNDQQAGWAVCIDGEPVGFALADRAKGELLVIAVLPASIGKGLARELMRQAEAWLFSHGWSEIHLAVPDKAQGHPIGFFQHLGWIHSQTEGDRVVLRKANPRSCIKLEEHLISAPGSGYSRLLRLQRGPTCESHRLCLFLDGESYWRDMDAIPLQPR